MLNLRQRLRASDVTRWHIVSTSKRQSVAEHSYNVALICEEICTIMNADQDFRLMVQRYAIHHDIPEVALGDLPTSVKAVFGDEAMEEVEELSKKLDPLAGMASPAIHRVVKLADLLDSIIFLAQYGVGTHAKLVREVIRKDIGNVLFRFDWPHRDNLRKFVEDVAKWETNEDNGEDVLWNQ